jgi:hypothetical protein
VQAGDDTRDRDLPVEETALERALESLAAIQFFVVGLSHVLQRHAWVDFFVWLRERGHAGVFVHGFLSLGFGSMILAFHNVWSGPATVLTVVGCLYLVKATLCFLAPNTQIRSLGRVSHERAWEFAVPGAVYVALAAWLSYLLWRA